MGICNTYRQCYGYRVNTRVPQNENKNSLSTKVDGEVGFLGHCTVAFGPRTMVQPGKISSVDANRFQSELILTHRRFSSDSGPRVHELWSGVSCHTSDIS